MKISDKIAALPERNYNNDRKQYTEAVFELAKNYRDNETTREEFVGLSEGLLAKNPDPWDPLLSEVDSLLEEALLDKEYFLAHLEEDFTLALSRIDTGYRFAVLPVILAGYVRESNGKKVEAMTVLIGYDGTKYEISSHNKLSKLIKDKIDFKGLEQQKQVIEKLPNSIVGFVLAGTESRRWTIKPEISPTKR